MSGQIYTIVRICPQVFAAQFIELFWDFYHNECKHSVKPGGKEVFSGTHFGDPGRLTIRVLSQYYSNTPGELGPNCFPPPPPSDRMNSLITIEEG